MHVPRPLGDDPDQPGVNRADLAQRIADGIRARCADNARQGGRNVLLSIADVVYLIDAIDWGTDPAAERTAPAGECECTYGYLLGQEYGNAGYPDGWTPVQRCDLCQRFDSDETAARAAADVHGVAVAYFDAVTDDEPADDVPGDWAIERAPSWP